MLLAVDIGNTNTKFGVFDGEALISSLTFQTIDAAGKSYLELRVGDRLDHNISSAIICSVVPPSVSVTVDYLRSRFAIEPVLVTNDFDFGLTIKYRTLETLGTDRLVNAFSAVEYYGEPVIVCSLGTATVIDVVNPDRVFLGGLIAPGMEAMAAAMRSTTARLPRVPHLTGLGDGSPRSLIGNSTSTAIRSGVYYGYINMVEGLIEDVIYKFGNRYPVIATGGNAAGFDEEAPGLVTVNEMLTLDGLRRLSLRLQ